MTDLYRYVNQRGKHRDLDVLAGWRQAYATAFGQALWPIPAKRLARCGQCLTIEHYQVPGAGTYQNIRNADACLQRFCPVCQRTSSLKAMFKLLSAIDMLDWERKGLTPLFLTLTIPAVPVEELKPAIDNLLKSWKRFRETKQVRKAYVATFRALETNVNRETRKANPHFHVLLFAHPDYFNAKAGLYLRQRQLIGKWRQATGIPNTKVVDIRRIRANPNHDDMSNPLLGAVLECAKYTVKATSLIDDPYGPRPTVDPELLDHLHSALRGRRLHAYTGVLAKAAKAAKEAKEDEDRPSFLPEHASLQKTETWKWRPQLGKHVKTQTKLVDGK